MTLNKCGKRYVIHQGGTRSGKTYAILQYLLLYLISHPGSRISIVGQTMPHLQRGAIADLLTIISGEKWNGFFKILKSEHRIIFQPNGSYIEYFSASAEHKLRGPGRGILFVNECNTVSWDAFRQLDVRTSRQTLLDFNPVNRFWAHTRLIPLLKEADYSFTASTYKDNRFLSSAEIENIERQRAHANWWRIYGEGELGNPEGKVFVDWEIKQTEEVKMLVEKQMADAAAAKARQPAPFRNASIAEPTPEPHLPGKLVAYGIDFGFSHSATAVVQVNELDGQLWVKEHYYKTATHNDELLKHLKKNINLTACSYGDPSAPQTIEYLNRNGWRGLEAAESFRDSVEFGLNLLLERKIFVTSDSVHLIAEMQDYEWDKNRDGEYLNRPKKVNDHAIDAMRYAMLLLAFPPRKFLVAGG